MFSGHPRFFLGSDSAPHPRENKSTSTPDSGCAAGVYTSPILLPLVAHLLESFGALDKIGGFVSTNGRRFYGRELVGPRGHDVVKLRNIKKTVDQVWSRDVEEVVSFWAGKELNWSLD